MTNPSGRDVADANLGLIVAPAGCGKTYLISEALKYCSRRQLVLTHTHAGVKAIRDRMDRLGVAPTKFRVSTLDAFALRYATAFPRACLQILDVSHSSTATSWIEARKCRSSLSYRVPIARQRLIR